MKLFPWILLPAILGCGSGSEYVSYGGYTGDFEVREKVFIECLSDRNYLWKTYGEEGYTEDLRVEIDCLFEAFPNPSEG